MQVSTIEKIGWELIKGAIAGLVAIGVFLLFLEPSHKVSNESPDHPTSNQCQEELP